MFYLCFIKSLKRHIRYTDLFLLFYSYIYFRLVVARYKTIVIRVGASKVFRDTAIRFALQRESLLYQFIVFGVGESAVKLDDHEYTCPLYQ
jgi:hypothetical protein